MFHGYLMRTKELYEDTLRKTEVFPALVGLPGK